MTKQKMTYQERVDDEVGEVSNSTEHYIWTQRAKRNIAAQAEAIREFAKSEGFHLEPIEIWLLEHGYIEPKTDQDDSKTQV